MSVEFEDFSIRVTEALEENAEEFLLKAANILKTQAQQLSPVAEGQLKGSWDYTVDLSAKEAKIGSPEENAIWNEFGTGEYAAKGNGRSGYWVFVKDGSGGSRNTGKSYSLEEAKQVMAILRSKGLEAYYTKGKRANHTLQKSFEAKKSSVIRLAERLFGEGMS